jgi:putative DNA primase/helicase
MAKSDPDFEKPSSLDVELLDVFKSTLKREKSIPADDSDSTMSTWLVSNVFKHRIAWNKEFGWLAFHHGVWNRVTVETITEVVRRAHESIYIRFNSGKSKGTSLDSTKVTKLLATSKIRAVLMLLAGQVEIPAERFDQRSDLLNTPTGVIVLNSLEILPHDPSFLFTKITNVGFVPGSRHSDIDELMACLPDDERQWLVDRLGQSITGSAPDEATMTLMVGFGANGKTSLMHTTNLAFGNFVGRIPVGVLSSSAKSGPNDNMTLRGVRIAVIEEFPEGHTISNRNLKEVIGTPVMQGRFLYREWVVWDATHTLFVTTNELPRIDETDHGTWRRFDVVSFPYRFVSGLEPLVLGDKVADPKLMSRIAANTEGQLEAFLALIVESANALLSRGGPALQPTKQMTKDKENWRERSDKICGFVSECLEFDERCHVSTSDLYNAYSVWTNSHGNKPLAQATFLSRFFEHQLVRPRELEKERIRSGQWKTRFNSPTSLLGAMAIPTEPPRFTAIRGLRFKD